jgi:precorrin-8X/cobalt-precorrin-8 methylmutase
MIHPGCGSDCVKGAYLQFSEPDIMTTIKECAGNGAKRITIHPYFLSSGMHVTKDIPEMIEAARALYPAIEFVYTEPLGVHEKLLHVIIDRIKNGGLLPSGIEKRSFEIISEEENFSDVPADRIPIIQRVIHATADFEFKKSIVFHQDAVATGLRAIRAGKDILTDIEMVRAGINKRLLGRWGGKVICNLTQESPCTRASTRCRWGQAGDRSQESTKTRSEIGIEHALQNGNNIGIIAIGNAPTALIRTIELLADPELKKRYSELLVVGVPVGFVNAYESKALLASQKFPFITNLSRKGGTPVAVAIVNALLKIAGEE